MKKTILITIGLIIINLFFLWVHRLAFQSSEPFSALVTLLLHFIFVLMIPYHKIYKKEG